MDSSNLTAHCLHCVCHHLTPKVYQPFGTPQGSGFITKSDSFSQLELKYLKDSNCTIVREAQRIQIDHEEKWHSLEQYIGCIGRPTNVLFQRIPLFFKIQPTV